MDGDLRATMTQKEKCRQYNIDNNIILSDKIFTDNNPNDLCDTTLSSSSCSMFSTITGTNQSTINIISNQQSSLPSLNYSTGTAETCLDAIVKDSEL